MRNYLRIIATVGLVSFIAGPVLAQTLPLTPTPLVTVAKPVAKPVANPNSDSNHVVTVPTTKTPKKLN